MTTVSDTDDDEHEREMSLKKEDTALFHVQRRERLHIFYRTRIVQQKPSTKLASNMTQSNVKNFVPKFFHKKVFKKLNVLIKFLNNYVGGPL